MNVNYSRLLLTELPMSLDVGIEGIDLSVNEFTDIDLSKFTALKKIDLSWNELTTYPKLPPTIETINLQGNYIPELPPNRSNQIKRLDLSSNDIVNLDTIGDYTNIEWLNISSNFLHTLPSTLASLSKLSYLNLGHNNLSEVSEDWKEIVVSLDLTELVLDANVSKETYLYITTKLPKCKVTWSLDKYL